MNAVEVSNLTKRYKKILAVDNISFKIKKGEIFGILGPNGAGKTTTINCITQLANKTSGKIKVNNYDTVKNYLEARKQIGLSPQDLKFDPYFSIEELLIYQAGYYGIKEEEAKKKVTDLLKLFDLYEKRKVTIRELSGGMLRRLSLAKAMIHSPSILILDEPTAALDVESRYSLWDYIKKINKEGITIILTTHYIEEAERLCDTICIMQKGKIIKLEEKKRLIEDLSRNIIKIYLPKKTRLPEEIKNYKHQYEENILEMHVTKKEQSNILNNLLKIFDQNKIQIINFTIEQDNLENIFRRLVKNEKK